MRLIDADELKKCAIPCELHNDLISREYLRDAFDNLCCHNCKTCRNFRKEGCSFYRCDLIDNAPTVETSKIEYKAYNEGFKDGVDQGIKLAERPHGKWLLCEDSNFSKCSICGVIWLNEECNNYCPNCGTYMRSENNGKK